ncbi:hypothetical protein LNQ82_01830 [Conchiformibius steedae DSM 2580]|uniref:Uncharacterized protein n=1 Tax=Conchiformibius steedae DSM 2580 TaxID=1121352 RepID=A0AAE9L016_9NEIS|nr:hypothetical protein [Conchiformibius steedae]QMT33285.1 hypothetical protein H3L98_09365 [Conchiformibius steedae]URD67926.1 hypothetical protein LNQ82_01830 [Conchiformibius steedae DSM 2580]
MFIKKLFKSLSKSHLDAVNNDEQSIVVQTNIKEMTDEEIKFEKFKEEVHRNLKKLDKSTLKKGTVLYRGTDKSSLVHKNDREHEYWYSLYENTAQGYPMSTNKGTRNLYQLELIEDLELCNFTNLLDDSDVDYKEFKGVATDVMILHSHFFPMDSKPKKMNNDYVAAIKNYNEINGNRFIHGFYRDHLGKGKNEIFILNPSELLHKVVKIIK